MKTQERKISAHAFWYQNPLIWNFRNFRCAVAAAVCYRHSLRAIFFCFCMLSKGNIGRSFFCREVGSPTAKQRTSK